MATPLGELLRQLRSDTDVQIRFHQSPAEYLHEHGWGDLDAADMQEALLLLADAAPASEAAGWIAAGQTVDPSSSDAALALDAAIGTLHDPHAAGVDGDTDMLDDADGDALGEADPGELDGIGADTEASESAAEPPTASDHAASPAPEGTPDTPNDFGLDELVDDLDRADDEHDDLDASFDPTAPDTTTHTDTPPIDDPADTIGHDLDPEPDWDDPS